MKDEKTIWGLGISVWITIIINVITLVFLAGVYTTTIKTHDTEIKDLRQNVKQLDSSNAQIAAQIVAHTQILDSLVLRANKTDVALSDIGVLKNDMDWLKRFLLAKEAQVENSRK